MSYNSYEIRKEHTLPKQKKNNQGKLEHIEDNGFIFKKNE